MKQTLIERYIYAVTKQLPRNIRQDVAKELNTIIDDMLMERCGDTIPSDHDIKVVLQELGAPNELAMKYKTNKRTAFIEEPYYSKYLFVLKVVIPIVFAISFAVSLITGIIQEVYILVMIGRVIAACISSMLTAFSAITIIFAIFSYNQIALDLQGDSIDNLPPIPKNESKISMVESVFSIIFTILFPIIFLVGPQFLSILYINGEAIPFVNESVFMSTWYLIVAISVVGIIHEVFKLMDHFYTKRVFIATVVCDIISFILIVIWLNTKQLIHPEFIEFLTSKSSFFLNFDMRIVFIFIALIFVIDIASTFYKTFKYTKEQE